MAEEDPFELSDVPYDYHLLPRDDLGPRLNATVWSLAGVSLGILLLRIYCKVSRRKALWYDDYVLVAAWVRRYLSPTSLCPAPMACRTKAD